MRKTKKISVQLEDELWNGENSEERESEMWKIKQWEKLASSWLRWRGIEVQNYPTRKKWGEGVSIVNEERQCEVQLLVLDCWISHLSQPLKTLWNSQNCQYSLKMSEPRSPIVVEEHTRINDSNTHSITP